jgi:PKD repeat protein
MRVITITILFVSFSLLSFAGTNGLGKKQVKLIVQNNTTGFADEATIYLDYGTSAAYNFQEDAPKTFNSATNVPQIYTLTSDSVACLVNGYGPFISAVTIGVGVRTDTSGTFSIFQSLLDNFDEASIIQLEDRATGIFHDLRGSDYTFTVTQSQLITGRFVLHISYPPIIATTDADCGNTNGSIEVVQDSTIAWTTCKLFDSVGIIIATYPNITGSFSFNYLPEGNYNLSFTYNDYTVYKPVYVVGHSVSVSITASSLTATVGQIIQFYSYVSNATYYTWNFGDGTIVTVVANPEVAFYEAGTYTVILQTGNAHGCQSSDTLTITITAPTGITEQAEKEIAVVAQKGSITISNLAENSNYHWQVVNLLGAVVSEGNTTGSLQVIPLNNQPQGIYLITLSKPGTRLTKKFLLR